MAVSRVGDRNLTLPERRSLSTSPWDLEAEILTLRRQLNVLRRKSPKRLPFSNFDRLFASLYWIAPRIVNALVIVKPETVIRWHRAGFRSFRRWKSRSRGGRPKVALEIRQLISTAGTAMFMQFRRVAPSTASCPNITGGVSYGQVTPSGSGRR